MIRDLCIEYDDGYCIVLDSEQMCHIIEYLCTIYTFIASIALFSGLICTLFELYILNAYEIKIIINIQLANVKTS